MLVVEVRRLLLLLFLLLFLLRDCLSAMLSQNFCRDLSLFVLAFVSC